MSNATQVRRWAAQSKRDKLPLATEAGITPDEARAALYTMLMLAGVVLTRVREYDARANKYRCAGYHASDTTKPVEVMVGGTEVAMVVQNARRMMATPRLVRRSERKAGG